MRATARPPAVLVEAKSFRQRASRHKWRGVFVFLLAADAIVLLIYLLLLPKDRWEQLDVRWRAIGQVAASVGTYFGLNKMLQARSAAVWDLIDSSAFRAVLLFITLILWPAILPIWHYELVFEPPPHSPPVMTIGGESMRLHYSGKTKDGRPIAKREGLLLRSYDFRVEGSQERYSLPAISVLKGTFLNRPEQVDLPCTVQLPIVPDVAKVSYRRYSWESSVDYGDLPGDGKVFLMQGHYDYVRVETTTDVGSAPVEVNCPFTALRVDMRRK